MPTMFSSFTVSKRVGTGFALLLTITLLLGGFSAWWMSSAATDARFLADAVAPEARLAASLTHHSTQAQLAARTYGFTGESAQLELVAKHLAEVSNMIDECRKLSQEHPSLDLAGKLIKADTAIAAYRSAFDATRGSLDELALLRKDLDEKAAIFVHDITAFIAVQNKTLAEEIAAGQPADKLEERHRKVAQGNAILDAANSIRIANFKAQALRDHTIIEKAMPQFEAVNASIRSLRPTLRHEDHVRMLDEITTATKAYHADIEAIIRNAEESEIIRLQRAGAGADFDTAIKSIFEDAIARTTEESDTTSTQLDLDSKLALWGALAALIIGPFAAWFITRSLNRILRGTASGLSQGAAQIASASNQVSSTSQSLAEGASEQAASLEEISSSLEELSSATKHNAENASAAKAAADTARASAEHGAEEMKKMEVAMSGIQQSSQDISKIIKTIDEIAFQTNILALNAAVEAARAGEAGAGFAVVADEVRTLAQRCAVAARETTGKISDATQRSQQGVALTASVSASLAEIVAKSRDVDRLVAEVANASREQSSGLQQVNIAVTQMDKVTQANAASAEEAASAAEELNAQSLELRAAAEGLAALVGLQTDSDAPHAAPPPAAPAIARPRVTVARPVATH